MTNAEITIGHGVQLAPLAGITDPVFRVLARMFGAWPPMTEMVSAHGVAAGATRPLEDQLLLKDLEHLLAVQLVGSDPRAFVKAGQRAIDAGAASINLNMACPARKIIKGGKGVALMRDPDLAYRIMCETKNALPVPVTVKLRSGWDAASINVVEIARLADKAGLAAVFVHPRTRTQGFSGKADWSLIRAVREAVSIPVVGNGDVRTPDDAARMIETTGCHGVMVGRAALGAPWLFHRIAQRLRMSTTTFPEQSGLPRFDVPLLESGDRKELGRLIRFQIDLDAKVKTEWVVVREMRKHLIWYSRGLDGAHAFRTRIATATDYASLSALVDSFFA